MSEDLPALGYPTSPTSATLLSSRTRSRASPGSPSSAKPGALRRVEASAALPRPPRPPCAATKRVPAPVRSASTSPCSSRTTVPSGTRSSRSSPSAPLRLLPAPCLPLPAFWCGWWWKSSRVWTLASTTRITSPPRPPLPPSGPPSGLNFSRWTEATPWPPLPAVRCSTTRSTKLAMVASSLGHRFERTKGGSRSPGAALSWWYESVLGAGRPQALGGTMFTVLRPRERPNFTAPASRANSVSSLPRPTPAPGWNLVPRWRTRISPALTTWPPKRLTPRNCGLESRPLRELEAPFLCAMVSHSLLRADTGDAELGQLLTVPHALVVAGLVLVLVNADLRALGLPDDLGSDLRGGEGVGLVGDRLAVDEQDGRQRDLGAVGRVELLDRDDIAFGDLVLLAAGLDDGVHRGIHSSYGFTCRVQMTLMAVLTTRPTSRWAVVQITVPPGISAKRPPQLRLPARVG